MRRYARKARPSRPVSRTRVLLRARPAAWSAGLAAVVTLRLGVKAERLPLEEVAPPLSMRVELADPPEKR